MVIGISGDAVSTLKIFEKTNDLNFTLLSDITSEIASKFGVPIKKGGSITKEINGKEMVFRRAYNLSRWTFVIDKNGLITRIDTDVKAAEDGQNVFNFLKGQE